MIEGGLAELHTHLGGSVPPSHLGVSRTSRASRCRCKDYWEFDRMVSISDPRGVDGLDALDQIYHVDRADPVEPARGRALGARGDRRRLPLAADHDAASCASTR